MEPITKLSPKQKLVMKWAHLPQYRDKKAIICDGSVRSGKTVSMIIGFVHWAMRFFDGKNFGICGKTVSSTERNIITPLLSMVDITDYYDVTYRRGGSLLTIRDGEKVNRFYVFGGKDESSYTLIQGITLSGVLFDEVALMPQSFVDQAIARTLSEPAARHWFNCNPESSEHWFYKEWICNTRQKKAIHLHFTMQDNPILSPAQIADAEASFSGVFYDRYIRGLWCVAEGLIYPQFDKEKHIRRLEHPQGKWYISVDYGTLNAFSAGLWCYDGHTAYRAAEWYYSGRDTKQQLTNTQYAAAIKKLAGNRKIESVIVDPSAASFIAELVHNGFHVRKGNNDVLEGIRRVSTDLQNGKLLFSPSCKDCIREFSLYRWDEKQQKDTPLKTNDHAMDDVRYFVNTILHGGAILYDVKGGI
ncbi:MAG: PBSX family phage terminase large subunit [Oscillospiraceae bacterium]|nr:PBSX family phage terminase large subunit [Oscillospiraceae bacterium]